MVPFFPSRQAVVLAGLALLTLASGCLDGRGPADAANDASGILPNGPAWDAPVRVQQYGTAYEPSLVTDSFGRVYVMAHKGQAANEGTRLSSWLWYSEDAGASWQDLPSPAQAHTFLPGIEGDLAVDAEDRVYFVDTYLVDNTLSVWQASASGVAWQSSRPVHGTTGLDDRPWLVAAGDGILYYLGDHVASQHPVPESAAAGNLPGSRWWFYRSMDGALTWSPGQAVGAIGFDPTGGGVLTGGMCNMEGDRHTPGLVGIVCSTEDGQALFLLRSTDHGMTWTRTDVAAYSAGPGYLFPGIAMRPDGTAVLAWIDEDVADDVGGRIHVALVTPGGDVAVHDVTPFTGTFGNLWVALSPRGDVLVNVHGDPQVVGPDHSWSLHAIQARLDGTSLQDVTQSLIDADIGAGAFALGHFIQNAYAPDGSAYVAYQVQVGETPAASEIHVARLAPGAP